MANIHTPGILGMDMIPRIGLHIQQMCGLCVGDTPPILSEYSDIFNKPLKDSVLTGFEPFKIIKPTTEFEPKPQPARHLPADDETFVNEKILELLEAGVLKESTSAWRHSPVVVPKSDGSKRMVINYEPVNAQTSLDAHPVPLIDDLLTKFFLILTSPNFIISFRWWSPIATRLRSTQVAGCTGTFVVFLT